MNNMRLSEALTISGVMLFCSAMAYVALIIRTGGF